MQFYNIGNVSILTHDNLFTHPKNKTTKQQNEIWPMSTPLDRC